MITHPSRWLLQFGLIGGLAASGYAYQRGQASQATRLAHIRALADHISANNQQRAEANAATVRSIARIVCLNNNWEPDRQVLTEAQQIQARTQGLLDTVSLLRRQLQGAGTGSNLASPLAAQLNRYTAFIQRYAPERAPLVEPSPVIRTNGLLEQIELDDLPPAAALAALTRLEAWLRHCEAQALQQQAEKVGGNYDGFNTIGALAVPITEAVAPGGDYQARLFLAESGHRYYCNLDMMANGVPLTQSARPGMQVQFTVPARRPGQPDTVQAHWHGTIRGPLLPNDTILQLDVPYLIVKPRTP